MMDNKSPKFRIISKAPPGESTRGKDVQVILVRADGTEENVPNIKSGTWHCEGRHTLATITIFDVEIEAEASVVDGGSERIKKLADVQRAQVTESLDSKWHPKPGGQNEPQRDRS